MKPTRHSIEQAVDRHGVPGTKRKRGQKITEAVAEAMETGVVAVSVLCPWEAQVLHPDGRRWIVDLQTQRVITSLPRLDMNRKERR